MINETILKIRQNPILYHYLKYHSYWYKILMRDKSKLESMVYEMKKEYKITPGDKIENIGKRISTIRAFLEVFN